MSFGRKGVDAATPVAEPARATAVRKFRLNSRKGPFLAAVGLFGAGGLLFGSRALTNERGVTINRVIELEPGGASVFYAVLAVVSLFFVAAALMALFRQFGEPQWLMLDQHAVSGPQSIIMNRHVRIPYADLVNVKVITIRGSSSVELRGLHGQKIWLANASFDRNEDLQEFLAELDRRTVR